jgi:hypothetical protein
MSKKRQTQQSKRSSRGYGNGSQLDRMRSVRKDMPPATKVEKPKKPKQTNWRDLIDDDEMDDYEEWE